MNILLRNFADMYFDKDAETKWLNEICAKGWAMTHFFAGFYTFEKCEPGKYTYQIDFGEKMFAVSDEYRELMNDTGVEIVQCWGYWIILRKLAAEGVFELYTDVESKIEHYTKIRKMFKIVTIIELICLWIELMVAVIEKNPYGIPLVCLLAAFVIVFTNITIRTTDIISQLKEIQSGIKMKKRKNISVLLAVGLLFNSCALIIQEDVSVYITRAIQIIAIVLMLAGVRDTCRRRNK